MEPCAKNQKPEKESGRISIRIPFLTELDEMASKAVRTRSDYIRMVLREHVKVMKAKRKVRKAA